MEAGLMTVIIHQYYRGHPWSD